MIDRLVEVARRTRRRGGPSRATASWPRTRASPRRAEPPASSSSARRRRRSPGWATRRRRAAPPSRRACRSCRAPRTRSGSDAEARRAARDLGFPVMIKAARGGGGKGMRVVATPGSSSRRCGWRAPRRRSAFGDAAVYLEKAIVEPRHVEIQVLADAHGHVVHLGERECSIQRRHQKLIEESPSPVVDAALRAEMGGAACRLLASAGYQNAGTVEFLLDADRRFYFLEVNTRLQVEHPVTELVTGIDLVREQLRIAAGEQLGYAQEDVAARGWAIECRISAEDPAARFIPSPGRITTWRPPAGPWVRVDAGVYEGGEVPLYYDPLMAKLIVWGRDREEAMRRMSRRARRVRRRGRPDHHPVPPGGDAPPGLPRRPPLDGVRRARLRGRARPRRRRRPSVRAPRRWRPRSGRGRSRQRPRPRRPARLAGPWRAGRVPGPAGGDRPREWAGCPRGSPSGWTGRRSPSRSRSCRRAASGCGSTGVPVDVDARLPPCGTGSLLLDGVSYLVDLGEGEARPTWWWTARRSGSRSRSPTPSPALRRHEGERRRRPAARRADAREGRRRARRGRPAGGARRGTRRARGDEDGERVPGDRRRAWSAEIHVAPGQAVNAGDLLVVVA